jgi:hypothetical protein
MIEAVLLAIPFVLLAVLSRATRRRMQRNSSNRVYD